MRAWMVVHPDCVTSHVEEHETIQDLKPVDIQTRGVRQEDARDRVVGVERIAPWPGSSGLADINEEAVC